MLSILIPIYNFDVRELVDVLHKQASSLAVDFEIRCYDDGSAESFRALNSSVASLSGVIYTTQNQNIGRSAIRNRLAAEAVFPNLLFMDCDSKVPDAQYLKRYIEQIDGQSLIYGGRSYAHQPPADRRKYLRWKYGVDRETIPVGVRRQHPYDSFMTNNFLIPKNVFLSIKLDEALKGYGHEDTKFGYALLQQRVPIVHIDNPLIHIGLEDADEFLKKTDEALENLLYLYNQAHIPLSHLRNIRLLKYFNLLKRTGMRKWFLVKYSFFKRLIEKNLYSEKANMLYFDLYRLARLSKLSLMAHK